MNARFQRAILVVLTEGRVGFRRVSPVALRPREGPLTEPIAGPQPRSQERVFVPDTVENSSSPPWLTFSGYLLSELL